MFELIKYLEKAADLIEPDSKEAADRIRILADNIYYREKRKAAIWTQTTHKS